MRDDDDPLCDNCLNVYNPEQLQFDDDWDGNGLGFACDFCPWKPVSMKNVEP